MFKIKDILIDDSVQAYAHVNSTPFSPASGAYIFRPLYPEAIPVSIARRM